MDTMPTIIARRDTRLSAARPAAHPCDRGEVLAECVGGCQPASCDAGAARQRAARAALQLAPRPARGTRPPARRPSAVGAVRVRLREADGFMLAEQLIGVIFLGLLAVAVAAGLTAALSAYSSISTQTRADAMLARAVETVSDQLSFAQGEPSVLDDGATATFVSATTRAEVQMRSVAGRGIILSNAQAGDTLLVADEGGMGPRVTFAYDDTTGTWTCSVHIVPDGGQDTETLAEVLDLNVVRMGS